MTRNKSGFSLVELLMASAIAAVVMGGLYASVAAGMTAWRRMQDAPSLEIMVALERMGRQFANAPVFSGLPCQGTDSRVGFPALIQPAPGTETWTLGWIEYYYDPAKESWCVWEQTYGGYLTEIEPLVRRTLVTGISAVTLEYLLLDEDAQRAAWISSWPPPEDEEAGDGEEEAEAPPYPLAVRATVVAEDPRGRSVSYMKSVFHWVQ